MRRITYLISFVLFVFIGNAQDDITYKTPPKDILDLVTARPTPSVTIDSRGTWMIMGERSDFPSIEDMAQPELRIAGLRINPRNFGPSRSVYSTNFTLKEIGSRKEFSISGLPSPLKAGALQWSPDEKKFAFTQISRDRIDLYLVDLESKTAKKINIAALNAVAGGAFWWAGNDRLVYKTVPANYRKYPDAPAAPRGPIVQENMGKAAAARTYQDLIKSPYDEDLFDYMATAQLVVNEGGMEKPIGKPAIYTGVRVSPDKNFLLVETVNRPFSYLVPVFDFPETVSVIDMNGKLVRTLATNPSSEGQPIGFDDAVTYPRNFNWRDDEPSTVVYVQALDKGLGRSKSDFRDAVYAVKMSDAGEPKELFRTKRRVQKIMWGNQVLAIFQEGSFAERKLRMNRFNPSTGKIDSLHERSSNDSYSNIGIPVTRRNEWDREVILVRRDGNLLLSSGGAGPKGDLPLLQTWNLKTGQRKIVWQSEEGFYEVPVSVIDGDKMVFITRRESPTLPPNYYLRNAQKKIAAQAITDFENPYKQLEGVVKQKTFYTREDGINLTGDLYLPKGYDAKKDGPLPVIMWAYPIEYKSASDAAQVRGSKFTFTRLVLIRVLHPFIQPLVLLPQHVQDIFLRRIAMRLIGQQHKPHCAPMTLDGIVQPFALDRKSARIVIHFSMDHQQGRFYFVGIHERTHAVVYFRRFPVSTFLALETEGRERAVIGTAARNTRLEQLCMRQQVSCHKGTVTVPAYSHSVAVAHTHLGQLVNGRMGIEIKLRDEHVIRLLTAFTHNGHFRVIQHGIALRYPEYG
jgi:dipeptidyl aminopeptidase/acylaminoacyl peptidase